MSQCHSHIGIPRIIEKGFSNNNQVSVFDTIRNSIYKASINRLGTKNNYYDEDVEKELLAKNVEKRFSEFYKNFCDSKNINEMQKVLNSSTEVIQYFFGFMFMRTKKTLDIINDKSPLSKICGNCSHSELLRIQTQIKSNPFLIIGENYYFYPIVNNSKILFINNSIGFGMNINSNKDISIIIPLNNNVAIFVSGILQNKDNNDFCIEEENKADSINKCIVMMEKIWENGFIFGKEEKMIKCYSEYYKTIKVE